MLTDEHERAMKVWEEAFAAWDDTPADPNAMHSGDQAAAAVIAADRAGLVARIAELKSEVEVLADNGCHLDALCKQQEAEIERLLGVVDALLQHDASSFWGVDAEKNRRASYRGVVRKAKKARAALKDTSHDT